MPLPWPAGQTPYVTPDQLYSPQAGGSQWPVGVQWGTIPSVKGATPAQQAAVLAMICAEATTKAEACLNQPLRATLITEETSGPDYYVTVQQGSCNGRIIVSRWPVIQVTAVQTCPSSVWPRVWRPVPAGNFGPEYPVQGLYGTTTASGSGEGAQSVIVAPGYITRGLGRFGWRVKVTYLAGWPHTCLTAAAGKGDDSLTVDDCTGWAPPAGGTIGAAGIIYDAIGGGQEAISVTASSVAAGPGTLTLSSSLSYAHPAGIMVSAMPQTAIWASALFAGQAALTRGATSTTIQTTTGRAQHGSGALAEQAKSMLHALRRTI